jgi:hypothetical protein
MATAAAMTSVAGGRTTFYSAKARWSTVRIETEGATYVGRMYIPENKKRLSDVLCDERPFISLIDVMINDSEHVEPFVALNKGFVRMVRILNEGDAEVAPLRR